MKKILLTLLAAALSLSLATGASAKRGSDDRSPDEGEQEIEFKARLSGGKEVPSVDTETAGKFKLHFDEWRGDATYKLFVYDGVRVTQAHLHCAPPDANGPVVVFLAGNHERGWDVDGKWIANATITDENIIPPAPGTACPHDIQNMDDLVAAMLDGDIYVNVHTQAHPAGEVRGQLRPDD